MTSDLSGSTAAEIPNIRTQSLSSCSHYMDIRTLYLLGTALRGNAEGSRIRQGEGLGQRV